MNYSITLQNYQFSFYAELITAGWTQRWLEGPMKRHRYLRHGVLLVSLIIWWLNGSTQSWARRGTQTEYWWWLVQEQTTDCSLTAADADIFIQLAQLTVIKENKTLRLVCMGRRRKKNQEERQRVSSVTFSGQQASSFQQENDTHTHTFLPSRHTHKYLYWTEASFPALLYLIHIKYHFPEKISSLLGTERSHLDYCLQAINKNWILSPITVVCSAGPRSPKTSLMRSRWENWHVWPPYIMISKVVKLMVSI